MKNIFVLFLMLFLIFTSSCSNDFKEGAEAYERKDYKAAFEKWKPLAEEGHDDAQYKMGRLYREGHGVDKDYVEAYKWYAIVAKKGYGGGHRYMNTIKKYMSSNEIEKAQKLAEEWMEKHK